MPQLITENTGQRIQEMSDLIGAHGASDTANPPPFNGRFITPKIVAAGKAYGSIAGATDVDHPGVGEVKIDKLDKTAPANFTKQDTDPTKVYNLTPVTIPDGSRLILWRDVSAFDSKGVASAWYVGGVQGATPGASFICGYLIGWTIPTQKSGWEVSENGGKALWLSFARSVDYGLDFAEAISPDTGRPWAIRAPVTGFYEVSYSFRYELVTGPLNSGIHTYAPTCDLMIGAIPGTAGAYPFMGPHADGRSIMQTSFITVNDPSPSEVYLIGGTSVVRVPDVGLNAGDCCQLYMQPERAYSGGDAIVYSFEMVNMRMRLVQ